ncbi:MAG: XVIPCD domain-containing protein [Lysobacteraceae bacterium]
MPGNDDRKPKPATEEQMEAYDRAIAQLATTRVPVLHADPRDRVFYALFDGTSNDADNKPEKMTNVGKMREQFKEMERAGGGQFGDGSIAYGYLAGPGTQQGQPLYKLYDNATGASYGDRLSSMSDKLAEQTKKWQSEYTFGDGTPETAMRVRVVSVGFSRGAEQAAGFSREVDEKGIRDKDGTVLVAPGKTVQVVGLYDPVGTGEPYNNDRRMPHSVLSGFQITAESELRGKFPVSNIIATGVSGDESLSGVRVPGAHGDVGGGPRENGLSNRAGNLMIDYLNSMHREPVFEKMPESLRPELNLIHRPDNAKLWRVDEFFNGPGPRDTAKGNQPDVAPPTFHAPSGRIGEGASEDQKYRALLDDRAETRRLPQSADTMLADTVDRWQFVKVALQPSHRDHPDHSRYMDSSSAVDMAFRNVPEKDKPSAEKLDQIAANMTLVTKANHMEKVDIGVLALDKSAVYAVHGHNHDVYDPTNFNLRVGMGDQELKPTMQAFRQTEQLAQPQQHQAIAPQQQQLTQTDPQPSHSAPVLNRYG